MRAAVGLAIGAILVAAFLRLINTHAVYHHLAHLDVGYALLCGVAFLAAYVVRALRWRSLLRPVEVTARRAVAIYQVATFLNWLLPIRGGELAKSLLLRHTDSVPISRSLATVGVDKTMDLLPAIVLVAVLPFVPVHLSHSLWVLLAFALVIVGLGAVLLALAARRTDLALAVVRRVLLARLPGRAQAMLERSMGRFLETLLALIRRPRVLIVAALYTAVAVSFDALFCLLAFRSVGEDINAGVVLYGYTLYNLAFILPTPPGQVGSNELIGLLIFADAFGVNRSGVGAMFLFSHPWTAVLMTVSGFVCLSVMGLTLRSTVRMASDKSTWEDA